MKLFKKENTQKKIKNEVLFKRGSYSLAITALVIAGIIVVNILVGALSERFVLEFDMSSEKVNTISEDNKDYIKGVDTDITITVCADKEDYVSDYGMAYYAQQYSVDGGSEYYEQTIKLLDRYADYNKKIDVKFMDVYSSDFSAIMSKYSNEQLAYGDIIVSAEVNGAEKYKIVTYNDIYSVTEASYYSASTIQGNNVETAITSAIVYVTSEKIKRAAILTGHSKSDYTENFQTLLKSNNYEIDVIENGVIKEIPDKYDLVVICAPNTDFMGDEIEILAKFLDNNGKLNKGIMFFADSTAPKLPNLYDFLKQWGINVGEGVLFETDEDYHIGGDPMYLYSVLKDEEDETFANIKYAVANQNAPLTTDFESKNGIKAKTLVGTFDTVVAAPKGTSANWNGYSKLKKQSYATVIEASKSSYDDDNNPLDSYIYAFSSPIFLTSQYNEESVVSNKEITLKAAERICKAEDSGITFNLKEITTESFSSSVTESKVKTVRTIFMFILPTVVVVACIVVYVKRRNAK